MPQTIAVLNPKGGSGKTTIAIHLARSLHLRGERTLLVDSDVQGSTRDWSAAGQRDGPPVIGLDRPTLDKELQTIGRDYQWVVIDGASKYEQMIASGIKAADLVLIPIQPSPLDLWACAPLVEIVQARQQVTDGRPAAAFVVTRSKKGTILARDIRRAIEEYGFPLMKGAIHDRTAFARALASGSTVLDFEAGGEAAFEISQLTKQIVRAFDGT